MPVLIATDRKTIVFNKQNIVWQSRIKPGNFEPQLLPPAALSLVRNLWCADENICSFSGDALWDLVLQPLGFWYIFFKVIFAVSLRANLLFLTAGWVQEKTRRALPIPVLLTREQPDADVHLLGPCGLMARWCVGSPPFSIPTPNWKLTVLMSDQTWSCENIQVPLVPIQVQLHKHREVKLSVWCTPWVNIFINISFELHFSVKIGHVLVAFLSFNNEKRKVSSALSAAYEHKLPTWRGGENVASSNAD